MTEREETPETKNATTSRTTSRTGRFAYHGLDRAIHERARLGIMVALMTCPEGLLFNDLKDQCDLTDGNLSRHLRVLQEAQLVEVWKGHKQKRSSTLCRITPEGRQHFVEYLTVLEQLVADGLSAAR
jgi:DNA-binding MarR family transcriptional regulator